VEVVEPAQQARDADWETANVITIVAPEFVVMEFKRLEQIPIFVPPDPAGVAWEVSLVLQMENVTVSSIAMLL